MQVVLEARNLYRFYHANEEEVLALRDVSICVQSSEMVASKCSRGNSGPVGKWKIYLASINRRYREANVRYD
jgi:hypothetical protein